MPSDVSVVVRVDASSTIGRGHLERSFALGSALRQLGCEICIATATPELVGSRAKEDDFDCVAIDASPGSAADGETLLRISSARNADAVIVDGYPFLGAYLERIYRNGPRVCCIDDGAEAYACDVLLNANIYAEELSPRVPDDCLVLAGPSYALLRTEVTAARDSSAAIGSTRGGQGRLLVTLGGSDQSSTLGRLAEILRELGARFEIRILLGGSRRTAVGDGPWDVRMPTRFIAEHLVWADLILSAAGTTLLEIACIGRPVVLLTLAENQRPIAKAATARGLGIDLGSSDDVTPASLRTALLDLADDTVRGRTMVSCQRGLVDGKGAARAAKEILAFRRPAKGIVR